MSHSYFIPKRRHAELIGKGGATVKGLQQQYNVRINIPSSQDPSCEVAVTGKGDLEAVRKEFERILGFAVSDKPLKAVGLNIKKDDHGALIGKGGATLKQIQANSGCVINIPKREDNSNIVSLEGTEAGIAKATAEIEHILGYKPATGAAQVYEAKEAKVPEMHIDHSKPLVDALFFPDLDGDNKEFNRFLGYLNSAQKTLDICVFTITDDRITNVILGAQKRGVKVRLITDNDTAIAEGSDIALFKKLGVLVKMDTTPFHMHHKFGIMDGKILINGSFNWTRSASTTNQENVMVTNNADFIKLFQGQFDLMWNDEKNFSSDAAPSGKSQH